MYHLLQLRNLQFGKEEKERIKEKKEGGFRFMATINAFLFLMAFLFCSSIFIFFIAVPFLSPACLPTVLCVTTVLSSVFKVVSALIY